MTKPPAPKPARLLPSERRRVATSSCAGAIVAGAASLALPWQAAVLVGWDVAASALLAWIWLSIRRLDATATRAAATREDNSRAASMAVVSTACVASLAGVAFGIVKARQIHGTAGALLTVAAVLAVVLAWLAVHTVFTLRYTHRYFDLNGGIDFNGDEPTYLDFAYFAFTVGMTFQVSDTDVSIRAMRLVVLRHSLLSYLFGTVIVGLTINVLGGLLG